MLIKTLFEQAQLAEATYADFSGINFKGQDSDKKVNNALITLGFSIKQTEAFTKHWKVVSHQPNMNSGFSATLFQNKHSGEFVFANRGTETTFPELIADVIAADVFGIVLLGKATHQLVDKPKGSDSIENLFLPNLSKNSSEKHASIKKT